ncbi:cytochrome c oxidase subunit II [Methyloligella solikamskensis]|uniref:C-type cytochrome n=1 Tax=Methyloligella solikamskensis TaxID=1177756 RepID=A0ABW3J6M7_9HYPH
MTSVSLFAGAYALADDAGSKAETPFTVEITGHQWWWSGRYLSNSESDRTFTTASEFHIPAGKEVRFQIRSADVMHGFWVPRVTESVDAVPGQVTETTIKVDEPGVYQGQCGVFCGAQHQNMKLSVVVDEPEDFEAWYDDQLKVPEPPEEGTEAAEGMKIFAATCSGCHAVRDTAAGGVYGPNLSHLMTRSTLGSGMLTNDSEGLARWIDNPQQIKPGCRMPDLGLDEQKIDKLVAYMETLD